VPEPHQLDTRRENAAREGEDAAKRLAQSHYENFSVGSFLLPRELRQELYNIYAFCRLADDFADETAEGVSRSDRLDEWERGLDRIQSEVEFSTLRRTDLRTRPSDQPLLSADVYGDPSSLTLAPSHFQLFTALAGTIQRCNLPLEPFKDLLNAFRQDLVKTSYQTWEELLAYCRLSANPVGRLVLGVSGSQSPPLFALSDKICTALQLANHWQDVADDYSKGRIYVPKDILDRFGVQEESIAERRFDGQFRAMMVELVDRTEELFTAGCPLLAQAPATLKPQLYLYWGGGMAALAAIKANDYDVLNNRSRVRRGDRIRLAAEALVRWVMVKSRPAS